MCLEKSFVGCSTDDGTGYLLLGATLFTRELKRDLARYIRMITAKTMRPPDVDCTISNIISLSTFSSVSSSFCVFAVPERIAELKEKNADSSVFLASTMRFSSV